MCVINFLQTSLYIQNVNGPPEALKPPYIPDKTIFQILQSGNMALCLHLYSYFHNLMVGFLSADKTIKRFIPQFEHLYGSTVNKTISADCALLPIHHLSNEFNILFQELSSMNFGFVVYFIFRKVYLEFMYIP